MWFRGTGQGVVNSCMTTVSGVTMYHVSFCLDKFRVRDLVVIYIFFYCFFGERNTESFQEVERRREEEKKRRREEERRREERRERRREKREKRVE